MSASIRQLTGFVKVARLGSFTRAAEQLHITQAGLSAMVRDLEATLGCRLFDRTTRLVTLTREGAIFLPSAERILAEMDDATANIQAATATARRILTIAMTPIVSASLLPQVCRELAELAPSVTVRVRDVPQPQIQQLVENGDVDVGFAIFPRPTAGLDARTLLDFRMMCIAPAGAIGACRRRRAAYPELRWDQLPSIPLIALPFESSIQKEIDSYLGPVGRATEDRSFCNSMQTIIAMVGAGYGAAILPSIVIPQCPADQFDLAYMCQPDAPLPYHLVAKKGHQLPQPVEPFVKALTTVASRLCGA